MEINIQTGEATNNLKALREEMKNLKSQLIGLEEGSEEYNKVLQQVANKTRDLTDMNNAIKNSAADLGQKLGNITKVGQGLASGFSAVQATMALFGTESETLQKTMVKLQAGIALVQGLGGVEGLTKTIPALISNFKGAGNAVKGFITSLKGIKAAIAATGIGLLVIAIGEVIANWDKLTALFKDTSAIDNAAAAMENLNNKVASLAGVQMQRTIRATEEYAKDLRDAKGDVDKIREAEEKYAESLNKLDKDRLIEENESLTETIKDQTAALEALDKKSDEYKKIEAERDKNLEQRAKNKKSLADIDAKQAKAENAEIQRVKALSEEYKVYTDALQKAVDLSLKLSDSNALNAAREEMTNLAANAYQSLLDESESFDDDLINNSDKFYKDIADHISFASELLISGLSQQIDNLNEHPMPSLFGGYSFDDQANTINQVTDLNNKILQAEIEANTQRMQLLDENSLEYLELKQKNADLENQITENKTKRDIELEKNALEKKKAIMMTGITFAEGIAGLLSAIADTQDEESEESFETSKKLQIASTIVSTLAASILAYQRGYEAFGGLAGIIFGSIQAATMLATGFATVKQIENTKFGSTTSSSGSASPTVNVNAPTNYSRTVQTEEEYQEANTNTRVYILESDIQESNTRVQVRQSESTF